MAIDQAVLRQLSSYRKLQPVISGPGSDSFVSLLAFVIESRVLARLRPGRNEIPMIVVAALFRM
jgi:hypothetical protein